MNLSSDPLLLKLLSALTGRLDAAEKASSQPLEQHFEAYRDAQIAKGMCEARKKTAASRLRRVARECGWQSLADFTGAGLEAWLAHQTKKGASPGNRNDLRQELLTFANWCVRTQRLIENPFASVPRANAKADPHRMRRALTADELKRLLFVARWRPLAEYGRQSQPRTKGRPRNKHSRRTWQYVDVTYEGLASAIHEARVRLNRNRKFLKHLDSLGRERQLIYKVLALTGLRRGELASLKVRQLYLDGPNPFIALRAADEKNRKGNTIPLRADLAAEIRQWRDTERKIDPQASVFSVPKHLLKSLNRDLAVAGIPKVDEHGRTVDVHALRHSFCTLMSEAGVTPRVAQAAMRHSTIDLTMNVYTDETHLNVRGALNLLPEFPLNATPPNVQPVDEAEAAATEPPGAAQSAADAKATLSSAIALIAWLPMTPDEKADAVRKLLAQSKDSEVPR